MKLFLDSANLEEIREVASWGVLDGVTTNPSLCSKENATFEDNIRAICAVCAGPVSAECVSLRADEIVVEGRRLARIAPNVVVKIPVCLEGLKATKTLHAEGVPVNMTLIFSASQALLAAKAGARFVSPFIGRLDDVPRVADAGHDDLGFKVVVLEDLDDLLDEGHAVLGGVVEAALIGADIATVPYGVMEKLVKHPLTDIGIERFLADWRKVKK